MSLLNQILQQMQAFSAWRTDVVNNSKTTEELDPNTPFDSDVNIRVSKNGLSKRQPLSDLISQMQGLPNGIIQISPIELLESPNRVKIPIIPVIPIWRIGGVEYQKETETILPIDAAASGMYRTDIVIAKTDSGFEVKKGTESAEVSVPYTVQPNEVEITRINIFEGTVTGQEPVPAGKKYITKFSKRYISVNLTHAVSTTLNFNSENTTFALNPVSGSGVVEGLESHGAGGEYSGIDLYFKNVGATAVTLKHGGSAEYPYSFKGGEDLVVNPDEIVHCKLSGQDTVEFVGSSSGGSNPLFLGTYLSLAALTTAHPAPDEGSEAHVNEVGAVKVQKAIWDNEDSEWVIVGEVPDTPTEEQIIGNATELTNVNGSTNIDLSTNSYWRLELSGNASLTFTNTPENGKTFVKTFKVITPAEETFDLPGSYEKIGAHDPTKTNLVTINFANIDNVLDVVASFSQIEP